jgi:hypothetical protein
VFPLVLLAPLPPAAPLPDEHAAKRAATAAIVAVRNPVRSLIARHRLRSNRHKPLAEANAIVS